MIKVVIVEDEIIICELIINLINWEQHQIQLVGKAHNGIDAYDLITQLKPDIVITDIRMPGMNGLELIEKVKQNNMDPMFIIISGHKEFEYARNAIKFGVDDYLLKPIKKDELNNSLAKLIKKRNEKVNSLEFQKNIQEQLTKSVQTIRKERLFQYYYAPDLSETTRTALLKNCQEFHFASGIFRTMVVRVDFIDISLSNDSLHVTALDNFCNQIQTEIFSQMIDSEYAVKDTLASFLINYSPNLPLSASVKKKITDLIKIFNYKYDCLQFSVGLGQAVDLLQDVPRSTATAHLTIDHRLDDDKFDLVDFQDLTMDISYDNITLTEEEKAELAKQIATLNPQQIKSWLVTNFNQHYQPGGQRNYQLYTYFDQLITFVQQTFIATSLVSDKENLVPDQQVRYQIATTRRPEMLSKYFWDYLDSMIQTCVQSKESQEIKPIRIAKQYISEHFGRQITLEDIAQILNLNPVYLGALFRNKTGTSFTNYLISVRIEKAKELLKSTSESISTISEMVGYSDSKHFSRLFTKFVGIKPVEYRKLYS